MNIRVRRESFFNFILNIDALNIAIIKPKTLRIKFEKTKPQILTEFALEFRI